tara:strand:+ start:11782 stop:13098 length:1317 start_codon:yes stop_codon:yes gene_type:complete
MTDNSDTMSPFGEWPVVINGKSAIRPPQVKEEEKNHYCLRSTRERLVWTHLNRLKPCAVCNGTSIDNFDEFDNLVTDISNGVRRQECKSCWSTEDSGYKSYRQHGNELWNIVGTGNSHTEVIYDRNCDASCLYCNKKFSTTWEHEINNTKHALPKILKDNHFEEKVDFEKGKQTALKIIKDVAKDYTKYACIGVYGGEPTITLLKTNYIEELIEHFYENNEMWNRTIRYDINSNFNFTEEKCYQLIEKLTTILKKYPLVNFVLQPSMESIGKNFNFIRSGCDWDVVERNLDIFLRETNFEIEIKSKINNVTLQNLPNFFKLMNEKCKEFRPLSIQLDLITYPLIFNIGLLENNFKKYFDEVNYYFENNKPYLSNIDLIIYQVQSIMKTIDQYPLEIKQQQATDAFEFYDYIKKERNIDLLDINPELYYYFKMLKMSLN